MPDPTLEKVAAGYNNLIALQSKQKQTMAKLIRACIQGIKSGDPRKRKEAVDSLVVLAEMLEKNGAGTSTS